MFTTDLAAPGGAGDTNIKVTSVTNIVVGITITVGTPANGETRIVASVGTAGAAGTGVTLTEALTGQPRRPARRSRTGSTARAPRASTTTRWRSSTRSAPTPSRPTTASSSRRTRRPKVRRAARSRCFAWVIDAHPEDINLVDFTRPDGTKQQVTTGDPRQLADAAFHAGTNSGSLYEWEETRNRLHFYVIDKHESADGVLRYTVAVQNIDGAGPHTRGAQVDNAVAQEIAGRWTTCSFDLTNTGARRRRYGHSPHPEDASANYDADVYRLSTSVDGTGWQAQLSNALATAKFGQTVEVPVYVTRDAGSAGSATISLTATSVSDATKTSTGTCGVTVKAPSVAYTLAPASPNGSNGWYNSGNVDLTWQIQDATAIVEGCDDETFSTDGTFDRSCTASSDGGTTGPVTVHSETRRDATERLGDGCLRWRGVSARDSTDAWVHAPTTTSGLGAAPSLGVTGGPTVGFFTVTCSVSDTAGNPGSASATYQVTYDFSRLREAGPQIRQRSTTRRRVHRSHP